MSHKTTGGCQGEKKIWKSRRISQRRRLNSKEILTAWRHRRPEEILKAINGSRKRGGDLERKDQNERFRRQRKNLKDEQDEHV